jgi:hypothetical protein
MPSRHGGWQGSRDGRRGLVAPAGLPVAQGEPRGASLGVPLWLGYA